MTSVKFPNGHRAHVKRTKISLYMAFLASVGTLLLLWTAWSFTSVHTISSFDQTGGGLSRSLYAPKVKEDAQERRSWAVIHVGPHKMASTIIQGAISAHYRGHLKQDHYAVPNATDMPKYDTENTIFDGRKATVYLALCLTDIFPCAENFWPTMNSFLNRTKTNLILSTEEFDKPEIKIDHLKELVEPWENVKIVVAYRRFYEWIVSLYFELNKFKDKSGRDTVATSLIDWLTVDAINKQKDAMYTSAVVDRYRAHFENVAILNMHDTKDILETFFCDYVPGANKTCEVAKRQLPFKDNRGHNLDYSRLISTGISRGLIRENVDILYASETFRRRLKIKRIKEDDLPYNCVSEEISEYLLNVSLSIEEAYVPEWYASPRGAKELREKFAIFSKSKLCSLDVDSILSDPEWADFFQLF